jgi:hypothetical protein
MCVLPTRMLLRMMMMLMLLAVVVVLQFVVDVVVPTNKVTQTTHVSFSHRCMCL